MSEKLSVLDSATSVNGKHILVALGKSFDKLPNGAILSSSVGQQWKIMNNNLKFQSRLMKTIDEKKLEGILLYDLQGIGHMQKPEIGQELMVSETKSN